MEDEPETRIQEGGQGYSGPDIVIILLGIADGGSW